MWQSPIFDRTLGDVMSAIRRIEEWKNKLPATTEDLKGCLNISDLNRIEKNSRFLSDKLNSLAYYNDIQTKEWMRSDVPNAMEITRIINNVKILVDCYYKHAESVNLPISLGSYQNVNSVEENLYLLKEILDIMTANFSTRYCGTFSLNVAGSLVKRGG